MTPIKKVLLRLEYIGYGLALGCVLGKYTWYSWILDGAIVLMWINRYFRDKEHDDNNKRNIRENSPGRDFSGSDDENPGGARSDGDHYDLRMHEGQIWN